MSVEFRTSTLVSKCSCHPIGWVRDNDSSRVWRQCPIHYTGQLHPAIRDDLIDEHDKLVRAELRSRLSWRIAQKVQNIESIRKLLDDEIIEVCSMKEELNKLIELDQFIEEDVPLDSLYPPSSFTESSGGNEYITYSVIKKSDRLGYVG